MSKCLPFKLLAILNKKQNDEGFLSFIASYKVLTANTVTFTMESPKINLPKFMRSISKVPSKLKNSICIWMFLMVSSSKSQGERNKRHLLKLNHLLTNSPFFPSLEDLKTKTLDVYVVGENANLNRYYIF